MDGPQFVGQLGEEVLDGRVLEAGPHQPEDPAGLVVVAGPGRDRVEVGQDRLDAVAASTNDRPNVDVGGDNGYRDANAAAYYHQYGDGDLHATAAARA